MMNKIILRIKSMRTMVVTHTCKINNLKRMKSGTIPIPFKDIKEMKRTGMDKVKEVIMIVT
ncbi:hypothetical protein COF61_32375 [Bacillus toyonensis]|nr:hypothetical protein COF61_32375 [Bacillus toyonensis]